MIPRVDGRAAVRLHPLTFLPEGDDVVIGRTDTDSYAVFPPEGAALVDQLTRRTPLDEAAKWYERTYGEPVDLEDFLATLAELDFLDDGEPSAPEPAGGTAGVRWQATGRAVFSRAAWLGYGSLVVLAALVCAHHPALLPHRDHVFFSRYLLVIELTVAFGQIPLILVHEAFHVLAARRLGLRARIRVSHRLYFVVFETVMDGLVIVPRAQRYLPMLAGMLADLLLVSVLTLGAWAGTLLQDGPSPVTGVCLALAFTTVVRVAMEFLLFLRTDVYYLVCTLCGCVDLHTTSREMVLNRLWRALGRPSRLKDPDRWHPNDVRAARWYAPLYVLGYGVALALLALVLLPISWRFLETAVTTVARPDVASGHFWDATGLLLLNVAQPAVAGLLRLRDRVRSRPPASARSHRTHEVKP